MGGQRGVFHHAGIDLGLLDDLLEAVVIDAEYDAAEHLDEAAIAVPGEAAVARCRFQSAHRLVVQAEVEHRIHHAGHRHARARTYRDEQWLGRIAEVQADGLLDPRQGAAYLGVEIIRVFAAIVVEGRAKISGDGETGRHRQADPGHLREVRPLAAEQVAHFGAALVMAGPEVIDPLGHHISHHTAPVVSSCRKRLASATAARPWSSATGGLNGWSPDFFTATAPRCHPPHCCWRKPQ